MPAGAGEDLVRAVARLPRHAGPIRPDRRILRPPWRVALVRPQRRKRPALPLPRLEIQHRRPMHRSSLGGGGKRLLPEDQAEVLSAGEARARALGLYGAAGEEAAAAGMGIRHGAAG